MHVAVAGGTGTVGAHVVELAEAAGHEVTVLARSTGVDLLDASRISLAGVDVVIDVTSVGAGRADAAAAFFSAVTRNLHQAEQRDGVPHHVALSIIGIDKVPYGYYAGKLAHEHAVLAGPTPWTILRAAQFCEFAPQVSGRARLGPLVIVPAMRSQPLPAVEVAARLVELAGAGPSGRVPDLAGPREERMSDLVRRWLRHRGDRAVVVDMPLPGGFGKGLRDGSILPGPGAQLGSTTFDDWLASQPA